MKYRNTRTGMIIEVPSKIEGELWQEIKTPAGVSNSKPAEQPKKAVNGNGTSVRNNSRHN